jgi:hypothetical protein
VEAADTDGVAIGNWLDRLRELALSGYRTEDVAFPPDLQVRLTLGSAGSTDQETTGFDLGPPDDTGNRSIRILGQGGTGTLSSEAAAFLFEPYWTLRDRSIWCTHAYFNLARIQITDAAGKTVELEGRIPPKHDGKHQDLILARRVEGVLRDLDPSQQKPLVNLMIGGLTTSGYMGEGKREDMGFDDPHLVVRWFEPENASMDGIPNDGPGTWRSLTIGGMRRADGRYYGVVDGSADLVFLVGSEDILPFFNLLQ